MTTIATAKSGERRGARVMAWVTFVLLLATGVGMALPGIWLATLGGSLYYAVAGLLVAAAAVLIVRRHPAGFWLYAVVLAATAAWSLWEVGFDFWALLPRLVFLACGGLWLLLPPVRRASRPSTMARRAVATASVALLGVVLAGFAVMMDRDTSIASASAMPAVAAGPASGEWTHFGSGPGGTRYSALAEITPANAVTLERAWVFRAGETVPGGKRKGGLQVTPLMVDGMVYGCTAFSSVFALDPTTGKQLWRHDPGVTMEKGGHPVCRGLAFFRAAKAADCPTRLLVGTVDSRLIAVDARTGAPCHSFGASGAVDLREGRGDFPAGWAHPTSPPTIVGGVAVIGGFVIDNQSTKVPPGGVRGYDATTGQLRWVFDPARPDDPRPLPAGQSYTPSTPNSWTVASGDPALGLVYVPMGNTSPDFFGGLRDPKLEKFSSAVVALDAATGKVRWTFQAVHHDLWDYDLAAQPVLTDFPTATGPIPALILATKTGQVFVLDRRTGRPLSRVEERRVPVSRLPGERSSPTQPFSTGMPDFAGPDLVEADMWGLTPFDQLYCRIRFRQARYEGRFTPMHLGFSIRSPGELGGIDWGSVSVDEGRRVLIVNSNRMANYDELITRAQAEREGLVPRVDPRGHNAPGAAMGGTPYATHWSPFLSGLDVPCQRPPYGLLTAVDLTTRKVLWTRPLGDARTSGPFGVALGLPIPLGAPNIGGALTTGGGLVFIGATQDEMVRAIDIATGRVVWQDRLPAGGHAAPMTYRGRDGHQYVLIAAGGGSLRNRGSDSFVAYRLRQRT